MSSDIDINKVTAEYAKGLTIHYVDALFKNAESGATRPIRALLAKSGAAFKPYLKRAHDQALHCKTLLNDEPTPITNIYVPMDLRVGSSELKDAAWSELRQLSTRIILTGLAGSGKSTAFRTFFLEECELRTSVPLLITLRNINDLQGNLENLILQTVNTDGGGLDRDMLVAASKKGILSFFFDGLDEVSDEFFKRTVSAIQKLSASFPKTRIVVSSRPYEEFQSWEEFTVCGVNPMRQSQACNLVHRMPFEDKEFKTKFVNLLESGLFQTHNSFASNPLLLTLMVLMFGENAEIPKKWHLFYDQAYQVLFSRHDVRKKGSFRRQLRSKLDHESFGKVFSIFSAISYSAERVSFDEQRFTHRTFQEYFAAVYVGRHLPQSSAKEVIESIVRYEPNSGFLTSLYGVNPELFLRMLLLPLADGMLAAIAYTGEVSPNVYRQFLRLSGASANLIPIQPSSSAEGKEKLPVRMHFRLGLIRDRIVFPVYVVARTSFPDLFDRDDSKARDKLEELLRRRATKGEHHVLFHSLKEDNAALQVAAESFWVGVPFIEAVIEAKARAVKEIEKFGRAAALVLAAEREDTRATSGQRRRKSTAGRSKGSRGGSAR
ncbi:MAG: NACHT domain-containing protein [Armatimonadetes bacterium]|nr:NACHT domain-containing protein [Armatimonadota bacterium]